MLCLGSTLLGADFAVFQNVTALHLVALLVAALLAFALCVSVVELVRIRRAIHRLADEVHRK